MAVDFVVVSLLLCAGVCVPLSLGTASPQELSFFRDNDISVKCAARVVIIPRQ